MRINYNSPVVLTFAIATIAIYLLSVFAYPDLTAKFFAIQPTFSFLNPVDYFRLFSHVMGHASLDHLLNNLTLILLLGPILEEKYGSTFILWIMVVTALFTGLVTALLLPYGLLGASGIVFAFIVLSSIVNVRKGAIPLSFILVFLLFIGSEVIRGFQEDNISQTAHIVGGIVGAVLGFEMANPFRS
jgi:membrane associated rhomboid family serine protease